jgi:hypothetical protein
MITEEALKAIRAAAEERDRALTPKVRRENEASYQRHLRDGERYRAAAEERKRAPAALLTFTPEEVAEMLKEKMEEQRDETAEWKALALAATPGTFKAFILKRRVLYDDSARDFCVRNLKYMIGRGEMPDLNSWPEIYAWIKSWGVDELPCDMPETRKLWDQFSRQGAVWAKSPIRHGPTTS